MFEIKRVREEEEEIDREGNKLMSVCRFSVSSQVNQSMVHKLCLMTSFVQFVDLIII